MTRPRDGSGYWRFALPLVILGPLMLAGNLAQQAALLGLSGGVRELAAFALAGALLNPFANMLAMAPQMGTVLGRDRSGYRSVRRLVLGLGFLLVLVVALVATTPLGPALIGAAFRVEADVVAIVLEYLLWFALAIPLTGIQRVATGVLVRGRRTATVTVVRLADCGAVIAILATGAALGWDLRATLIASRLAPELGSTVATVLLARPLAPVEDDPQRPTTSVLAATRFFAPMAVTTTMFTLSRPILFSFASMVEGGGRRAELVIAALSLTFSCGFIFQSMVNHALRNLMAAFGAEDPAGCRRFSLQLTALVSVLALLFLAGPPLRWFLVTVLQAEGEVLALATEAAPILVLTPAVIAWRNWYHGLAMAHRRTGAMLLGSLGRNGAIALGGAGLAALGWFDHRSATALLVAAFACEAVGTILASRRWRAELATAVPA